MITTDIFIERAKIVHGDKYDYSKSVYKYALEKLIINCPIHGQFNQTPSSHVNGNGCSKCSGKEKMTTDIFIERSKLIHGDKYDYSKTKYKNSQSKIKIICSEHGEFKQIAINHYLKGSGCNKCSGTYNYSNKEFIELAKSVHGDKYDYSKTNYLNCNNKIIIICKKHGQFKQTANNHLNGQKCLKCYNENKLITTVEFIERAKSVHGDKYDYSKTKYKRNNFKLIITCSKHGDFNQLPFHHLYGSGCSSCKSSTGENIILSFFKKTKFVFYQFYKIKDCANIRSLIFDFMVNINDKKYLIEYQGEQHYRPVCFGGMSLNKAKTVHKDILKRDKIKKTYCCDNNIPLLLIPYWDKKNSEYLISEFLK